MGDSAGRCRVRSVNAMFLSRARASTLAVAGAFALVLPVAPATPARANCTFVPPGGVNCPDGSAAVLGYIAIHHMGSQGLPLSYELVGALASPDLFSCSASTLPGGAFQVSCTPQATTGVTWRCDVLHADASTASSNGRVRTSLDCNGDASPEAQTSVVTGAGGHDTKWAPTNVVVTEFSCTVDGGSLPTSPDFGAGCGDPGAVTFS
jgi:hypothetical protein